MRIGVRKSSCEYADRLDAFWDGEASSVERRLIEAHLADCAVCRQRLRTLRALAATLRVDSVPETGLSTGQEFWQRLVPRLRRHEALSHMAIPAKPSPFLAPLGLVVSNAALQGLVILVSVAYALYQWHLLPASLPVAFDTVSQLLVGPMVWEASKHLAASLFGAIGSVLPEPGQAWYVKFQVASLALLLPLSALYVGWLLRWLRNPDRINGYRVSS